MGTRCAQPGNRQAMYHCFCLQPSCGAGAKANAGGAKHGKSAFPTRPQTTLTRHPRQAPTHQRQKITLFRHDCKKTHFPLIQNIFYKSKENQTKTHHAKTGQFFILLIDKLQHKVRQGGTGFFAPVASSASIALA
ncbi:hypothetical protein [Allofranklinella schreckenbergeri]|uniref:hypothetical protein n=1 Tax=Allofranklinella schreckenbergeri TaxID=1076744 RepID=UPI0011C35A98|nr:hypothetical protein [Allofranklinella schreckenbergeri]